MLAINNKWRVNFTPDRMGKWSWKASFSEGKDVAVTGAGKKSKFIHGKKGDFTVAASDKKDADFRAADKGRLQYVGEHYLRHSGSSADIPDGDWFIKAGADATENTLDYVGFDGTPNRKGLRKNWGPNSGDFDPINANNYTWAEGKGKNLLGMINYLPSQDLKKRFPMVFIGFEKENSLVITQTSNSNSNYTESSSLDLESLMKAAQAISGEVVLERLLKTLLSISIENAGAESGCMLLKKGDQWFIRSSKFAKEEFQSANTEIPLHENSRVPESLVQYIQNTNESLVLDDISKDPRFMSDAAVQKNKLKSVLCVPMLNKGIPEGMLYLENNLQESVFTENRVRFLELLSGQIAVSMENAHLYENLENRIEERTSELKTSLENLKSTQEQLKREHDKLDVTNKTKSRFFSIISHDLRGPMTNLMGLNELIKHHKLETYDAKDDKELDEITGYLKNSANQVSSLLDNLLSWALNEEGIMPFKPALLNIKACFGDTVSLMLPQAQSKLITMQAQCDESIEAYLDKNSFMTILRNLSSNAIKFTPENGTVSLSAWVEGKELLLTVSDNGIGIEQKNIPKIFEMMDDKVRWGTQGEKGTGLGLNLVHDFVKANGGSVKVDSEVGKGTVFSMNFPLS